MQNNCLTFLFIILYPLFGFSQKSIENQADLLFRSNKFKEAITFYDQLIQNEKKAEWYIQRAICNFESNQLSKAKNDLNAARKHNSTDPLLWYYTARIAHADEKFQEAASAYKNYLTQISLDHPHRKMVRNMIKRCGQGVQLKFAPQYAFVENLGTRVNTKFDEFGSIESPNVLGKYYFSSNRAGSSGGLRNSEGFKDDIYGNYFMDIYSIESNGGAWSDVLPMGELLNGPKHEVLMDFSNDGSFLLYYQSRVLSEGSIYIDSFNLERKVNLQLKEYISPVVGELGDIYCYMFNDSTLIFSSKRMGGFGGYDLYVTQKRNQSWIDPINLGPEVNTAFDEVSPSLSNDGTVLFFSSNGFESTGGFDIFKSKFDYTTKSWKKPKNLGFPVNSSEDDMYFRLSADGRTAIFSSKRKTGLGKFDLYLAYIKNQETSQLTFTPVLPYLFFNQKEINEIESELVLAPIDEEDGENEKNSVREYTIKPLYYGDDDVVLHPDNATKLTSIVEAMSLFPNLKLNITSHSTREDLKTYELYFSIKRAEKVANELINNGISPDRLNAMACGANYPIAKIESNGGSKNVSERYNRRIDLEFNEHNAKDVTLRYEKPVVADFLQDRRFELYKTLIEGLSYRVEVAQINQMFTHQALQDYNDALIEIDFDKKLYLYTLGLYSSYNEAMALKQDLIKNGIHKAKVIAYLNGERISRSKLVDLTAEYPDLVNFLQYEH